MAKKDKSDGKPRGAKKKKEAGGAETSRIGDVLTLAARAQRAALAQRLAAIGLHAGQDAILRVLGRDDGQVLGRLAEATGVRAPTVTKTVNRLAAQGIVEKRASGDDGRLVHVHLTDAGRDRLSGIEQALDATEAAMLGDLSAKEAKVLAKLLRRLQRSLVAADALGAA